MNGELYNLFFGDRPDGEAEGAIDVVPAPAARIEAQITAIVAAVGRSGPIVTVGTNTAERATAVATIARGGEEDALPCAPLVRAIPSCTTALIICILIQVARGHAEARRTRVIDGLFRGSRYIVRCGVLRIPHIVPGGVATRVVIVRRRVLDVVGYRGGGAGRVGEARHRAVFDVVLPVPVPGMKASLRPHW